MSYSDLADIALTKFAQNGLKPDKDEVMTGNRIAEQVKFIEK
jgi:hypothetical protein